MDDIKGLGIKWNILGKNLFFSNHISVVQYQCSALTDSIGDQSMLTSKY